MLREGIIKKEDQEVTGKIIVQIESNIESPRSFLPQINGFKKEGSSIRKGRASKTSTVTYSKYFFDGTQPVSHKWNIFAMLHLSQ